MTWLAIGALAFAVVVATGAFAYAAWIAKRGLDVIDLGDRLHNGLRDSAVLVESARGEIAALHAKLSEASDALLDERTRHRDEVGILRASLEEARHQLAAVDTADGISAGLSRGGS